AHFLGLGAVAVEMAMLENDACPPGAGFVKRHLDLRLQLEVELPAGGNIPGKDKLSWRLPLENAAPVALRPIHGALEPSSIDEGFDHGRLCRGGTDMMGG